ncbi:MAG: hypothetical protein WC552_08980 [Candidatus Omnitrophota bacterium]
MPKIKCKVDIKDLEKLMKDYPEASNKATISRVTEMTNFLERVIKFKTPEGVGPTHLRDTIFHKVEYGTPIRGLIGTPVEYGEAVEYGTKPHMPPRRPIIYWVSKRLHLSGRELREAVRNICWHIYQHGTKGAHMFENGFNENKDFITKTFEKIPDDIVKSLKK